MATHAQPRSFGRFAGLQLTAEPSVLAGILVLWTGLALAGGYWLDLPPVQAVFGGLIATALHYGSETVHHLGHAWAARRTGYPMTGIHFYLILGRSVYPADEPALPGRTHIRRAIGGPAASLLLALLAAGLCALAWPWQGLGDGLLVFLLADNLLLGLGALMPVSFFDGGTILHWWGK